MSLKVSIIILLPNVFIILFKSELSFIPFTKLSKPTSATYLSTSFTWSASE